MFELNFKRISIAFDFSFFATMSIMIIGCDNTYLMLCFIACIWHEIGHLIMMLVNRIKIYKIVFYGAGIKILPDKLFDFINMKAQIYVLVGGSLLNFITAVLLMNNDNYYIYIFAAINAVIGAFNFLPLYFLDGGKILGVIIHNLCSFSNTLSIERYLKMINVILILAFLIFVTICKKGNVTIFITLCYLLVAVLLNEE